MKILPFTRKPLWALCAAVIIAVVAPCASATIINGTLNFTVDQGSPAPTGSFAYNDTTNTWNSFTVNWDGGVFNFAPFFPSPAVVSDSGDWCAAGPTNLHSSCASPATFSLKGYAIIPESPTFTDYYAGANGTFAVTTTTAAVPEPGSLGLMLLGLVSLVFGMRWRRLHHGHRPTCAG